MTHIVLKIHIDLLEPAHFLGVAFARWPAAYGGLELADPEAVSVQGPVGVISDFDNAFGLPVFALPGARWRRSSSAASPSAERRCTESLIGNDARFQGVC